MSFGRQVSRRIIRILWCVLYLRARSMGFEIVQFQIKLLKIHFRSIWEIFEWLCCQANHLLLKNPTGSLFSFLFLSFSGEITDMLQNNHCQQFFFFCLIDWNLMKRK